MHKESSPVMKGRVRPVESASGRQADQGHHNQQRPPGIVALSDTRVQQAGMDRSYCS